MGIATVQLAKANGLIVIGTAGTEAGMKSVKDQGADYVFNHKEDLYMSKIKDCFPDGLDLIIEMLADVNLDKDIQHLKWKQGRVTKYQINNKNIFLLTFRSY